MRSKEKLKLNEKLTQSSESQLAELRQRLDHAEADRQELQDELRQEREARQKLDRWGNNGNSDRLFSWAPKSLWMVTAAMKLKDSCSLEENL